ncbi:YbjN domain-containing protein [Streptomyces sp. DSM 44917]|uniref:YbjN domain-containing protein n=1 Tax=Streptomyces boetiae TaxID=3075541 RepID=A0ABU2LDW3_9ACTN|nr:YbjN domain-containing protein [Streptomyces sp. DSM 44917]MDT0309751.1 YbjN domain-containing protein [Streptomyces sp. DSM 44917]
MSVDPSAIPNFGGKPQEKPGEPQQAAGGRRTNAVSMPYADLVKLLLTQMNIKFAEDPQGNLLARWARYRMFFLLTGEERQRTLTLRAVYERAHGVDDKAGLLLLTDEWNHSRPWPKAYTHTSDDGTVRVVGDATLPLSAGVGFEHLVASIAGWIRAAGELDAWLAERLPDEPEGETPAAEAAGAGEDAPEESA